jgi:membrane protein required for colicin V production
VNFEVIDIIFAVLVLLLVIRCTLRGFVDEVMSMASVVLGLGAAFFFHKKGAIFLSERYLPNMQVLSEILAFIALFVIAFIAVRFLDYILRDIMKRVNLEGIDRILGVVFGLVEGIVLVSMVLFVMTIQPLFDEGPLLEKSLFARFLLPFIAVVGNSIQQRGGG